jgi:hypothetical protein
MMILPVISLYGGWGISKIYSTKKDFAIFIYLISLIILILVFFIFFSPVAGKLGKKTDKIKYIFSSKTQQAIMLQPGFYKAIRVINGIEQEDIVLTSDNARYYNLCDKKGVYWLSPEMNNFYDIMSRGDSNKAYLYLKSLNINYIFIDRTNKQRLEKYYIEIKKITDNENFSEMIFKDQSEIYRLK